MKVYLNGEILDAERATVGVDNPSLLHGVGLFETLRTYSGRPFRLEQHIERLQASAAALKMPVVEAVPLIPEAVRAVLDENNLSDARVRITVTPPPAGEGGGLTVLVTAQATTGYPAVLYEQGMTIFVCTDFRQSCQDPLAGHKTTSYFSRLLALRQAQEHKCGEALWFTPENLLAEGSVSNVFLVREGRLRTPPLDTPILPGISRALTLELARELGIEAEETPCNVNDLLDAEEVFLTNSIMEVMPVTRVERRAIGTDKPGTVTRRLLDAYRARVQSE